MYSIIGFNSKTGEVTFKHTNKTKSVIDVSDLKYLQVSSRHYINSSGDIVLVPEYFNRVNYVDTHSEGDIDPQKDVYHKANQYEFDLWHSKEFPDSDNANIYNSLIPKLQ